MRPNDSPAGGWIRRIQKLGLRPERDAKGLYFVEGARQVLRVLQAGHAVEKLVYCEVLAPSFLQKRVRLARRDGIDVVALSPEQFRSISTAERASGVAGIVRQHWTPIENADPCRGLCWVAVAKTRSAGNLGTMLRTAEAAGVAGLIVLEPETDPFDPRVVRASMGGIFGLQFVRATRTELLLWSLRHGCGITGTSPEGPTNYTDVEIDRALVVLFGEERKGLTQDELAMCSQTMRIPMVGSADSLNLGVAAGVVLFDLLRRRGGLDDAPSS